MPAEKIIRFACWVGKAAGVMIASIAAGKFASDQNERKRRKKLDHEHSLLEIKLNERRK